MQQQLATIIVDALLVMPHIVLAQESNGVESIASRLTPGAKLSVITTDGDRLRARFENATASDLTVRLRDKKVVLSANKVASVTKHDSSWDGARWGALAPCSDR